MSEQFKVIVSNGLKNFHMSSAAAELDKKQILLKLFCGVYPSSWISVFLQLLEKVNFKAYQKLLGRKVEVSDKQVQMFIEADILGDIALYLGKYSLLKNISSELLAFSMKIFSMKASSFLYKKDIRNSIYHYRAGFGLCSLPIAKKNDNILLCDHSIVHPLLLQSVIDNSGVLSSAKSLSVEQLDPIWKLVKSDIDAADHVLVNSDFVKETFIQIGFDEGKISVIYQGVDDTFFKYIEENTKQNSDTFNFLFAGYFCDRKGAKFLIEAIKDMPKGKWKLNIAGGISSEYLNDIHELEKAGKANYLGQLSRQELAKVMVNSDAFIFPSLAEGSARVIFEAMASGCYIITTPNAGSIVQNNLNGKIISPASALEISSAMIEAINSESTNKIGNYNSEIIRRQYRQTNYGNSLVDLYKKLNTSKMG